MSGATFLAAGAFVAAVVYFAQKGSQNQQPPGDDPANPPQPPINLIPPGGSLPTLQPPIQLIPPPPIKLIPPPPVKLIPPPPIKLIPPPPQPPIQLIPPPKGSAPPPQPPIQLIPPPPPASTSIPTLESEYEKFLESSNFTAISQQINGPLATGNNSALYQNALNSFYAANGFNQADTSYAMQTGDAALSCKHSGMDFDAYSGACYNPAPVDVGAIFINDSSTFLWVANLCASTNGLNPPTKDQYEMYGEHLFQSKGFDPEVFTRWLGQNPTYLDQYTTPWVNGPIKLCFAMGGTFTPDSTSASYHCTQ